MRVLFYTLKQSFIQFGRNLNMSIISIFAITCMMLILSLFFIMALNINVAAETVKGEYDSIELFLLDDTTKKEAKAMIDDMKQQDGVSDAYYKSKKQALAEFKERWGDNGYLLDSLKDNPLPNSVVIMIGDLEKADALAKHAESYEGVEDIKYYKSTVDKLLKATHFMQIAAMIIMVFLIIVSIIVVSNTIKLTVFNRAVEISILKYVGATNWFIRGPFLVEGIIIGVLSAAIALLITGVVYQKIVELIGDQVYSMLSMPMVETEYLLSTYGWIFGALGVAIGCLGSLVSLRRFLDV